MITLATSLKTAQGEQPLDLPRLLYFTTVDENGEVSFGYGPKFQVVDPAGRRAVQFSAWGNLIRPITVRLYAIGLEQFLDRYTSGFRGVGPSRRQAHRSGRSQTAADVEDRHQAAGVFAAR